MPGRNGSVFRGVLAATLIALALPATASADSSIPGRAAALKRKPIRATPVAKKVVRSAVRSKEMAPHVPRTGLDTVTPAAQRLFDQLHKIANTGTLRGTTTAIYITDANTGQEIYAVRENAAVNPASNVKLIATAAALDVLGPDWRYRTRLFGPSPDRTGVAEGDLYLRGGFDPTLTTGHIDKLAQHLAERGLTKVDGDIIIGTRAERSAVAWARVKVMVTPGAVGEPPTVVVEPTNDMIDVVVNAKTTRRGRSRLKVRATQTTDDSGHERVAITIDGTLPASRTRTYFRTIKNRTLFTAHHLRSALVAAGIEVQGAVRQMSFADYVRQAGNNYLPVELATHRSAPMSRMVSRVNKRSLNWLADALVSAAGGAMYGGEPSLDKGIRLMLHWLEAEAGVPADQVFVDTGSGLSYNTKLSARQVVTVMREGAGLRGADETDVDADAAEHRLATVYRNSLSVAGRDGTLRRRFRKTAIRGRLHGKTGTLIRVIALSGLLELDDGQAVAFSLVTNGHNDKRRRRVKDSHEAMVHAMYSYLRSRTP